MIIYKCLFPNGKVYIGQTSRSLKIRKKEHKYDSQHEAYCSYNCPFYRAIRKYDYETLKWEIIDIADSIEELNIKEIYWIKYYNSFIRNKNSNGYNSNIGGGSNLGYLPSEETKIKISKAGSGEKNSRAKLSEKDVNEIRRLITSGIKQKTIADLFEVKEPTITKIKNGDRWKTVNSNKAS
jgi:group I intron endonuclease